MIKDSEELVAFSFRVVISALSMEAEGFSETMINTMIAWCRNPEDESQNNERQVISTRTEMEQSSLTSCGNEASSPTLNEEHNRRS
jgi:hypothetical protein